MRQAPRLEYPIERRNEEGYVPNIAPWPVFVLAGAAIGTLTGLFGVGGSSTATPLVAMLGVPGLLAIASPLPATIPAASERLARTSDGARVALYRGVAIVAVMCILGITSRSPARWTIGALAAAGVWALQTIGTLILVGHALSDRGIAIGGWGMCLGVVLSTAGGVIAFIGAKEIPRGALTYPVPSRRTPRPPG